MVIGRVSRSFPAEERKERKKVQRREGRKHRHAVFYAPQSQHNIQYSRLVVFTIQEINHIISLYHFCISTSETNTSDQTRVQREKRRETGLN